jgi:metallo-beta-lactamase class B
LRRTLLALALLPAACAPQDDPIFDAFGADTPEAQAMVKSWFEPAEPFRIVGPVHFVGTQGLGVYLIHTGEGEILLSGAMGKSAELVESSIRKAGFRPEEIKLILTSHAHVDHVGTHARFKRISGARVAAMEQEVELLQSGGATDFHYAKRPAFQFEPVKVDRVLHDGEVVTLGEVSLTAHLTPGHTRGCATWTTSVVENGTTYLVAFLDGTSINPGYRLVKDPSYPGIADDYRRTFRVLESLQPDIWLPFHTDILDDFGGRYERAKTDGVAAWIDAEGYRNFIAERKANYEKLVEEESSK